MKSLYQRHGEEKPAKSSKELDIEINSKAKIF